MAPFKGSRYLRCFYCNKPSKTRYDGIISEFLCLHCDATNHLDENGEITDPPVATTAVASQPTQYAIRRSASPEPQDSAQGIFCDKCLKNQRLYTASLAQYLPDDPNHPEYAQLERKYYKFRAALEDRYPQICEGCEPKVLGKLNAAGYVAKTDHLRRVMERNRTTRTSPRRRTMLGLADWLGGWLWWGSFALQLLWHMRASLELLAGNLPLGEQAGLLPTVLSASEHVTQFLPSCERLVRLALQATVLGIWWNPKFPQIVRGFSRPVLGLPKWYAFQALLVVSRYFIPRVVQLEVDHTEGMSAQFAIHVFMVGLVSYVYILAGQCVKVDTTPLFAPADISTLRPKTQLLSQRVNPEDETSAQNLSDVLDDILNTPGRSKGLEVDDSPFSASLPPAPRHNSQSTPQRDPQPHYSDEMEWTPTTSPPPAFTNTAAKHQPFGQPQTRENQSQNPFWAKVPAAPKPPSHRLHNPAPPAVEAIRHDRQIFAARFGKSKLSGAESPEGGQVDFATPSFFPPSGSAADPRSSLADMLGSSFSLGQEDGEGSTAGEGRGRLEGGLFALRKSKPARPNEGGRAPALGRRSRAVDAASLVAVLGLWLYAVQNPGAQGLGAMRASLALGALHVLRVATSTLAAGLSAGGIFGMALCLVELGAVGHLSMKAWTGDGSCGGCLEEGLWTMVGMLGHMLWDALA